MITAKGTRRLMAEAGQHWRVPLMDFVDAFRREPTLEAVREPFEPLEPKLDALLAAVVDALLNEAGIEAPEWLADIPPPREAWFVSGMQSLKALALAESPVPFRRRRVFVLRNFLDRV